MEYSNINVGRKRLWMIRINTPVNIIKLDNFVQTKSLMIYWDINLNKMQYCNVFWPGLVVQLLPLEKKCVFISTQSVIMSRGSSIIFKILFWFEWTHCNRYIVVSRWFEKKNVRLRNPRVHAIETIKMQHLFDISEYT